MRALVAFARLSRPLFLYGGFAGVALGAAIARAGGHALDAATYAWAQALVTSLHLMVHYANDYYDRACDVHAVRTRWSGGSGVLSSGALPARTALVAALACAALGALCALRFALAGNAATALVGGAILVAAWAYSAPPLRLCARGLGELDAAFVVGVLVPWCGYAAFAGRVGGAPLAAATWACFVAMLAMMLGVEYPDAGADAIAGKRNLVVRLTPSVAQRAFWVVAAVAALVALRSARATGTAGVLALLPACAVALAIVLTVRRGARPATFALLGVAFYATTVTGLVAAFALAPG